MTEQPGKTPIRSYRDLEVYQRSMALLKPIHQEFRAFLTNAMGSATEMEVHLEIARELGYVTDEECARLVDEYQIVARQLYRLIEKWQSFE
jgi:hypothetical protein